MTRSQSLAIPTTYARGAVIGRTRADALVRLRHDTRAGRIANAGEPVLLTHGMHAGQYAIPVQLIIREQSRERFPRWARIAVLLLSVPTLALALLLWVVSTLSVAALATMLGALLVAFCVWVRRRHPGQRRAVTVTTTTTVEI